MTLAKDEMDGVSYEKYSCTCGESILNMQQLKKLSEKHKKIREANLE